MLVVVSPAKRLDWVLGAFEELRGSGLELDLVIAGACEWAPALELIEQSPYRQDIRVTGYLSNQDFDEYTLAADVLPLMRFPSAGESSGVAARALGFGKVIVVPEYAAFSDLPDDICAKVWLDRPVVPQLVEAVRPYIESPERLLAKEEAVRGYARRHLSLAHARADLREILDTYWS